MKNFMISSLLVATMAAYAEESRPLQSFADKWFQQGEHAPQEGEQKKGFFSNLFGSDSTKVKTTPVASPSSEQSSPEIKSEKGEKTVADYQKEDGTTMLQAFADKYFNDNENLTPEKLKENNTTVLQSIADSLNSGYKKQAPKDHPKPLW